MLRLIETVRHHFGHEEHALFPIASRILAPARLEELGSRWAERRGVEIGALAELSHRPSRRCEQTQVNRAKDNARRESPSSPKTRPSGIAPETLRAGAWGVAVTGMLAAPVVVGSRNLAHFDAALVGYTFASSSPLSG